MPGGRPTKYDPKYCQELIEHMKEGYSYESFAGRLGVARSTLYEWEKHHPEFSDTKKTAIELSLYHWEKVGKEGMFMGGKDNPFQASIWVFNMKNRFGWADRKEVDQVNREIVINIDSDDEEL